MAALVLALVRLIAVLLLKQQVTGLLTDPFVENRGTVVLPAPENAANVSVFCQVGFQGTPSVTQWFLTMNGGTRNLLVVGSSFQLTGGSMQPNLTIVSFSHNLDMAILECSNGFFSPNDESAFFFLRIIEPPVLRSEPAPMIVVENSGVFSFNISQLLGYPPDPSQNSKRATLTYQWFHDGVAINTSTNPNVSVYPEITFNPVVRTQSGNYSMTASTEGGDSTGYFILDVLAPPDGTRGPIEVFGVTGMDAIITAFIGVTGNPNPTSTWTRDSVPLTSSVVYNTDNTGVLVISNVMLSDTGNYTNTLQNMFNNESFTNIFTISLQVLSPPSSPQSVSVINFTSSSVALKWLNPVSVGVPTFVRFSIELATTSITLLMSANAVNSINSSYVNTLTVNGLDPNTNYTISIRTVSTHPAVGDLVSDSIMQAITTLASVPQFKQNILYNNDGMLDLEWTLGHTGGLPLHSISVTCNGGNSTTLSYRSVCTLDMCGDGSTRLGPVMAGSSYTCSVTASNAVGNTTSGTNTIITLTGIPSIPVVSVSVDRQVRIQITTAYAGVVTGDNSSHFNLSVYNTTSNGPKLLYQISLYPLRREFLGASVLLSRNLSLQPGSYQFSATTGNRYGSSPDSRLTTAVTLVQSSTDSSPVTVIVTVSIISVVIVVIAVSVLISVVICIMRRHSGSMTKNAVKSSTTSPTTQAPVALQRVQTVENESYGVLGGGVPQSIELKDNAAYSTVKPLSAPSQSIAVNTNLAYGITPATTEPDYI